MVNYAALPDWTSDYVGLPYKSGGRTREGIDCWGLVNMVWAERLGAALPPYEGPDWWPDTTVEVGRAAQAFSQNYSPVLRGTERLGDGILIRMMGQPIHVGLVLYPGAMLHIEQGCEACIEEYENFRWSKRIIGIYRYEVPHG